MSRRQRRTGTTPALPWGQRESRCDAHDPPGSRVTACDLAGRQHGARPDLSADDGSVVSHAELASSVHQLASVLAGLGVAHGDRVAIVLPNGPEFVELVLAVTALGAAAAPLNPRYTEAEYAFCLADLMPSLLLVQAGQGGDARRAAGEQTVVDVVPKHPGPPELSVRGAGAPAPRPVTVGSPGYVAMLLHTSGTTRRPKQVPLLQRNLMASIRAIGAHYRLDRGGRSPTARCRCFTDTSSLTSVALTKVLFAKWWGQGRTFTPMEPNIERMMEGHDAGLVIGDPALKVDRSRYLTYDLAEEWIRLTGKPFVFAFWAVRQSALKDAPAALDLAAVFQDSRDHGLQPANLDRIAREWAPRLGLSESEIRTYLTENIHYDLDPACLEGLQLFYRYASECGALPAAPALRFLDVAKIAAT